MSRPKIVDVRRQPGGNAIGGVLVDGRAKLPFVRLASPKDEVVVGKEAAKVLGRGTWLPAQRLHNCFKSPQTFTVPYGLTTRRLIIIEFLFEDGEDIEGNKKTRSDYIVVSQVARRNGKGYVGRFRPEDSLIGAFYLEYRMDPFIAEVFGASEDFINPSYEVLTECVGQTRIDWNDHPQFETPQETMFQAVIQWWPWKQGKAVMMPGMSFKISPDGEITGRKTIAIPLHPPSD